MAQSAPDSPMTALSARVRAAFASSGAARGRKELDTLWKFMSTEARCAALRRMFTLGPVAAAARDELCRSAKLLSLPEGTVIYRQGENCTDFIYFVCSGGVDVRHRSGDGVAATNGVPVAVPEDVAGSGTLPWEASGADGVQLATPHKRLDLGPRVGVLLAGESIGETLKLGAGSPEVVSGDRRLASVVTLAKKEMPDATDVDAKRSGITVLLQVSAAACRAAAPKVFTKAEEALSERVGMLRQLHIFADWPASELAFMAQWMDDRTVRRGHTVHRAGAPADTVYLLQSGSVGLTAVKRGASGGNINVEHVTSPGLIGDMDLLARRRRASFAAVAVEDSKLLVVPAFTFHTLCLSAPAKAAYKTHRRIQRYADRRSEWHAMQLEFAESESQSGAEPVPFVLTTATQSRVVPCIVCNKLRHPSAACELVTGGVTPERPFVAPATAVRTSTSGAHKRRRPVRSVKSCKAMRTPPLNLSRAARLGSSPSPPPRAPPRHPTVTRLATVGASPRPPTPIDDDVAQRVRQRLVASQDSPTFSIPGPGLGKSLKMKGRMPSGKAPPTPPIAARVAFNARRKYFEVPGTAPSQPPTPETDAVVAACEPVRGARGATSGRAADYAAADVARRILEMESPSWRNGARPGSAVSSGGHSSAAVDWNAVDGSPSPGASIHNHSSSRRPSMASETDGEDGDERERLALERKGAASAVSGELAAVSKAVRAFKNLLRNRSANRSARDRAAKRAAMAPKYAHTTAENPCAARNEHVSSDEPSPVAGGLPRAGARRRNSRVSSVVGPKSRGVMERLARPRRSHARGRARGSDNSRVESLSACGGAEASGDDETQRAAALPAVRSEPDLNSWAQASGKSLEGCDDVSRDDAADQHVGGHISRAWSRARARASAVKARLGASSRNRVAALAH